MFKIIRAPGKVCFCQTNEGCPRKIVYIGCYWKSNERIELVFSHIKDRLSMRIIAKYHTFMPISNEKITSCILLGFTVRRKSTSLSTSIQIFSSSWFHCNLFKISLRRYQYPWSHIHWFHKEFVNLILR